jgi:CRISPR-associated endonuclease/helicase Cas3
MSNFADFFRGCTNDRDRPRSDPFPWQEHLAERLVDARPPAVVAVPTGLGKTGALVAWAWALSVI